MACQVAGAVLVAAGFVTYPRRKVVRPEEKLAWRPQAHIWRGTLKCTALESRSCPTMLTSVVSWRDELSWKLASVAPVVWLVEDATVAP